MYETIRTQMMTRLIQFLDSSTTQEVIKHLDRIMVDYDITKKETAIVVRDNSLEECAKLYILCKKAEGVSYGSITNITFALRRFVQKIGKKLNEITPNDIRAYLLRYQMETNIKNGSLEKIRQRLYGFFEWCCDEEYISRNPCRKIPKIISEPSTRHAISEEQLEYCRMACHSLREKALLEVFYSTGARLSEIARLNKSDIDWYSSSIRVYGKGKSYYTVYLNTKAKVALQNYLNWRDDNNPALFLTARGERKLSKESIRDIIEEIGKKAGIDEVLSPHVLRHTMATTALRNGASLETVQHMLNHKNPTTTQIYAEMDTSKVAAEHRRTVI